MLIVVLNTQETIEDALIEEYPDCRINRDAEQVEIDGQMYCYYQEKVLNMPHADISIYCIECDYE